jgi:uncharacterized protein YybS (DUF2232 family)
MLFFAASSDGSASYVVGRIFSLFLSLPWCLVADRYGVQEGSPESYYFDIGGMLINAGILAAIPVGYEMWKKAKHDRS